MERHVATRIMAEVEIKAVQNGRPISPRRGSAHGEIDFCEISRHSTTHAFSREARRASENGVAARSSGVE
jgi:hypothetical protein